MFSNFIDFAFSIFFWRSLCVTAALDPLPPCIEITGGVQRYAPGTRLEFLWERLLELNLAPTLLEPYSRTGHTERQMHYGKESPQVVDLLLKQGLANPELVKMVEERKATL